MNDDRTKWKVTGKELGYFQPGSGIMCRTRLWIQIVIKRNQMRLAEVIFTFGNHCHRIAPDAHLPVVSQFPNDRLKRCDSLVVSFEKKQRFHLIEDYSRAVCTGTAESGQFLFVSPK